jgi:hypothetical protein
MEESNSHSHARLSVSKLQYVKRAKMCSIQDAYYPFCCATLDQQMLAWLT